MHTSELRVLQIDLLEMRIEVEEASGGTEVRDAGLHTGSIAEIIDGSVIGELYLLGEAAGERREEDGGVKPEGEPLPVAQQRRESADDAGWAMIGCKPSLEAVAAGSRDEDDRVEVGSCGGGVQR